MAPHESCAIVADALSSNDPQKIHKKKKKEDLTTAFFAPTEIKNPPSMTNIFKVLCADAGKSKKVEEFDKEPKIFAMKKSNK